MPYRKINSKWIKDLKVRPDIIKLIEETIGRTLCNINHSRMFFHPPPRLMKIKTKFNTWTLLDTSIPVLWLQDETVTLSALSVMLLLRGAPRRFHFVSFTGKHWEDNNNSAKTKHTKIQWKNSGLRLLNTVGCARQFINPSDTKHKSLFYFSLIVIEEWISDGSCRVISQTFSLKILFPWVFPIHKEKQCEQSSFLQMMFIIIFIFCVFLLLISVVKFKVNEKKLSRLFFFNMYKVSFTSFLLFYLINI